MQLRILGLQGATSVDLVTAATARLSVEEAAAILTTTGLSTAQQMQILMDRGLTKEEAAAALATAAHSAENVAATATTGILATATASLKAVLKGLWATLMANPIIAVVALMAGLVAVMVKVSGAAKEASEAADEFKQSAMEESQAAREEIQTLDELIAKYKELAESDTQDAGTREEIKSIQSEITDLVGNQADNLDLVNGKLDEEIAKLNQIRKDEANKAVDKATTAYYAAKDSHDKAIGQDSALWIDGYAYVSDSWWSNEDKVIEILQNNGFKNSVQKGGLFNSHTFIMDSQDENYKMLEGATEKAEFLKRMIAVIEENYSDYASSNIWNALNTQVEKYEDYADDMNKAAKDLAEAEILSSTYDESLSKINVNSLNNYSEYRDKLIDLVKNSPNLSEAISSGDLTENDIAGQVDNYLATIPKYSDYYKEFTDDNTYRENFNGILESLYGFSGDYKAAYENLVREQQKIEDWGLSEFGNAFDTSGNSFVQSKFGNVDMDKRAIITWSDELKKTYANALASWNYDPEVGSIDTVFGGSNRFGEGVIENGIEVAFTPIMNVDGEAKFLDQNTVYEYIESLIGEAASDGKITEDELLNLDKEGRQIGETFVQGIIAAADDSLNYDNNGNWAETVGRLMHFSGDFGAIKLGFKDIETLAKNANVSTEDLMGSLDEIYSLTPDQISKLNDYITENGISGIDELKTVISQFSSISSQTLDTIEEKAKRAKDSTNSLVEGISSVQEILSSQTTGNSLSIDDYDSEELAEYTSALEYHNGVMQLNANKVNEIIKAKSQEQIEINNTNKAMAQSTYLENAAQIEKLRQKIKDKNFAEDESEQSIQNQIDALLDENSAIKANCDVYDLMNSSLQEATDAYHNWLNAQNAAQSGDMFDDTLDAINRINETLNDTDSEYYGRVGRTDYKAALNLIIPDSVNSEDEAKVNAYLKSIYDMFTYDDDGNRAGLNIENFCQKAVDKGLMVLDESTDSYQIAGEKTMEDFAKGMNLSLPLVQAMFGEMEEFGGEFSWADEAVKTIGDLGVAANESAEALRKIKGNEDLAIKLDVSEIEGTDDKISTLEATIKEMQNIKGKAKVDASEVEYANQIIEYCVAQQQNLSAPIIMSVDTSAISEKNAEAIEQIQEFKRACNDLELKQKLGVDTSDAQSKVNTLATDIKNIDPKIAAELSLDTSSVENLKTSINNITGEQLVKIGIDDSAIIGWTADNKTAKVTYDVDSTAVDTYKKQDDSKTATVTYHKISTEVDQYNPSNLLRTVTYHIKTEGSVGVNGTANVTGTAMAGGNWGAKQGGNTLVGELGREIVVDPHTGRWYTVGDTGAEFVDIPKGSIVFNHKQTESLLANGYVAGRASALVNGTAMVTGGIKRNNAQTSTKSGGNSTSNYGKSSSGKSSSSSSKSSSKSSEEEKEPQIFDWIEIALSRIQRAIDNLSKKAESTFKKLSTRLSATNKEISKVNEEINLQQKAADRYMKEANNVGLSSALAKQVREGNIQISEYDEDTQKLIEDYRKWYEKSLECKDAIADLHEELASLYEDNFNNVKDDFENQLELAEHMANQYETGIDMLEARGYLESTKYYSALQDATKGEISILNKELASLEKSFSDAMNSGEIEKYSESWYSMQSSINGVKEEIAEANVELAEYEKTMREIEWGYFDYTQERISQLTQEADFLIDLMSNSDLHTDKGQLTDEGMATMGLHGQNYNTYMAQADMYAQEILEIDKKLAKDPYNTELIERREELLGLQQDSILAAEDEKQAIVALVEEGINLELQAMQDLIDKYTESLDTAKD